MPDGAQTRTATRNPRTGVRGLRERGVCKEERRARPEDIQRVRDLTRLRQALRHDRTSWAQRLHAVLAHEGWPCSRSELLSSKGRRWLDGLQLDSHVRVLVDARLAVVDAVSAQMAEVERELRR